MNSSSITCDVCGEAFSDSSQLRLHNYRLHTKEVNATMNGVPIKISRNDDGVFICPCCPSKQYRIADSLKRHIKNHVEDKDSDVEDKDSDVEDKDSDAEAENDRNVAVILNTDINKALLSKEVKPIDNIRDYRTAVLSAFNASSKTSEEQEKKLLVAELGDLEPIAYIDEEGKDSYLLAASKVIAGLTSSNEEAKQNFRAVTPKKRTYLGDEPVKSTSVSIRSVISGSPYQKLLSNSQYIELDDQLSLYFNNSWTLNPIAPLITTKLLEEMIFVEGQKALLVLCGEIYSRLPSLDAHYENSSITKGNFPQSSLPHFDTRYRHVEVCLMNVDRSQKLVLGTKTMNALITSSIRIDNNEKPTIGPSSSNGFIPSRQTQIFVDKCKVEEVKNMIMNQSTYDNIGSRQFLLYPFDEFAQLRQLRSKFDKVSTYLCYRFSSKYTNDCRTRPFTIWTLADRSTNRDEDSTSKTVSNLFRHIATSVWKKGEEALLEKKFVVSLRDRCKPNHKIRGIYEEIEKLYVEDTSAISIIANKDLNRELKKLASIIASEISEGNERIAGNIHYCFNETSC